MISETGWYGGGSEGSEERATRGWKSKREREKEREREAQATPSRGWPRFSHSFYRAKRRRRRQQRERRLSIFTSNEFELKTFLPSLFRAAPARSLAAPTTTATLMLRPRRHPLFHEPRQSLRGIITPSCNACDSGEAVFLSLSVHCSKKERR